MKIRNKRLLGVAGWGGMKAAKLLTSTLHYSYHADGPKVLPVGGLPDGSRYLFATWHENVLVPVCLYGHPDMAVLVSRHADGQLLRSLLASTGTGMVHGSSTRGGIEAVKKMVAEEFRYRHIAVTPDGPRGPRRVVQPGIIYIASRTGMLIVPTGIGFERPWRLKSWDRMAIPKPFCRARQITADPISVPNGLRTAGLETYRQIVQDELDRLTAAAERWAETGRLVIPPPAEEARRLAS